MEETVTRNVVIVGGGITGLSALFYGERAAGEARVPTTFTLVERSARIGGKIHTERVDAFLIESGPDSFITQKPWGIELVRDLDILGELIGLSEARGAVQVLVGGRPRPLPDGMALIVPTKIGPFLRSSLLSPLGKIRVLMETAIPPRRDDIDETLADFVRRRLGSEALDRVGEPILAGVHNAEPDRQSILATFPRLRQLEREHGSLIRGMRAAARQVAATGGPPSSPFVTLRGGSGRLVEALAERLASRLVVGRGVVAISPKGGSAEESELGPGRFVVRLSDGDLLPADAIILATPAPVAASLLEHLSPLLTQELRAIRHVATGTVSLGFRATDLVGRLGGYGMVIPRSERRRINALTIASQKFDDRAPVGTALVRVFVGGSRNPDVVALDDAPLLTLVREELRAILGIAAEPLFTRIYRHSGNPQYDVGHLDRVARLEALCPPGIRLVGCDYRGVGIPDCVKQGKDAALAQF